jgi:hypothetical protein
LAGESLEKKEGDPKLALSVIRGGVESTRSQRHPSEHVPKKLLDFLDQGMLQLFDFERFLFDHVIPRDREAL